MSLPMRPRLPTVDDALQFSPLSSITPFDPGTSFHLGPAAHHQVRSIEALHLPNVGNCVSCCTTLRAADSPHVHQKQPVPNHLTAIIPFPSSFPRTSHTIFANTEERQRTRRGLDSLNAEAASNPQTTSYRLQQSLQQLQQLLRPSELTELYAKISHFTTIEASC